jgi:hypothetical protein
VLIHDVIDFLILHKEERREALRVLGEIKAAREARISERLARERGRRHPTFFAAA